MTYHKIFCFGDSWAYGSELNFNKGERPFANLLSEKFGCELTKLARPNRSLGLIVRDLSMAAKNINNKDLVLVVVPPDSRWYTQWSTIEYENNAFFNDKSNDWFEYHHQLFIFAICEMLEKIGCEYILMHNYGKFPLKREDYWFANFHHSRFLSEKSLTEILTDSDIDSRMLPIAIEIKQQRFFRGKYFKGCHTHPNQLGHEKIAQTIIEKLLTKDRP